MNAPLRSIRVAIVRICSKGGYCSAREPRRTRDSHAGDLKRLRGPAGSGVLPQGPCFFPARFPPSLPGLLSLPHPITLSRSWPQSQWPRSMFSVPSLCSYYSSSGGGGLPRKTLQSPQLCLTGSPSSAMPGRLRGISMDLQLGSRTSNHFTNAASAVLLCAISRLIFVVSSVLSCGATLEFFLSTFYLGHQLVFTLYCYSPTDYPT